MSKTHFTVLDGLRGMAAIVILVFHYFEIIFENYTINPLGHGYLAVDFFFCLSGFVIAYSYDDRMAIIHPMAFLKSRLIRLHPMVVMGSMLGLLLYLFDPFIKEPMPNVGLIALASLGSILMLPTPFLPFRFGALFPFNSPAWSLLMEYLASLAYALVLWRIKKTGLIVINLLCAAWLVYTAKTSGMLIGGWDATSICDGPPRLAFSFSAGLLVYRLGLIWKNRLGFLFPCLLLIASFLYPHQANDWLTESVIVIIGFPLILAIGAGTTASGWLQRFCMFIGRLSYPLYMTHIGTVWMFTNYYFAHRPSGSKLTLIVMALISLNLFVAYITMRFYDEPIRAWLSRKKITDR